MTLLCTRLTSIVGKMTQDVRMVLKYCGEKQAKVPLVKSFLSEITEGVNPLVARYIGLPHQSLAKYKCMQMCLSDTYSRGIYAKDTLY